MLRKLLRGARLLEVAERSSAYKGAEHAAAQQDSRPCLMFDKGVLLIENPFVLGCESGELASLGAIIGCSVTDVFSTDTELFVVFEGRISLRVSLRDEDFIGPEAATFRTHAGETVNVK